MRDRFNLFSNHHKDNKNNSGDPPEASRNDGIDFPNGVSLRLSNLSLSHYLCNFLYILLFLFSLVSKVAATRIIDNTDVEDRAIGEEAFSSIESLHNYPFITSKHPGNPGNEATLKDNLILFSLLCSAVVLSFIINVKLDRLRGNRNQRKKSNRQHSSQRLHEMHEERLYPTNNRKRIIRELRSGIMMTMHTIPISISLFYMGTLIHYIGKHMPDIPDTPVSDIELLNDDIPQIPLLMSCFIIPILEELSMRGIILPGMKLFFGKMGFSKSYVEKASIICNSLLFMMMHSPRARLGAFAGGYFYTKSTLSNGGSLWQSTAAHISHNSVTELLFAASKYLSRKNDGQ